MIVARQRMISAYHANVRFPPYFVTASPSWRSASSGRAGNDPIAAAGNIRQFEMMAPKATILWLSVTLVVFVICCSIMFSKAARDFISDASLTYLYITVWEASGLAAAFLSLRVISLHAARSAHETEMALSLASACYTVRT